MKCKWSVFVKYVSLIYDDFETLSILFKNVEEKLSEGLIINKRAFNVEDIEEIRKDIWYLFKKFYNELKLTGEYTDADAYHAQLIVNADIYYDAATFYEIEKLLANSIDGIESIIFAMKYLCLLTTGDITIKNSEIENADLYFRYNHGIIYNNLNDEQDTWNKVNFSELEVSFTSWVESLNSIAEKIEEYTLSLKNLKQQISKLDDTFTKKYEEISLKNVNARKYGFRTYNYNYIEYIAGTSRKAKEVGFNIVDNVFTPITIDESLTLSEMQNVLIKESETEKESLTNEFWANEEYLQQLPYEYGLQAPGGVTTTVGHYLSGSQLEDLQVNFYDEFVKLAPPEPNGCSYDGDDHSIYIKLVNIFYSADKLGKWSQLEAYLESIDDNTTLEDFEKRFYSYGKTTNSYGNSLVPYNYFHDNNIKMLDIVNGITNASGNKIDGKTYFEQDKYLKYAMYVFYLIYKDDSYMQRYNAYVEEKEKIEAEQQERVERINELNIEIATAKSQQYALRQYEKEQNYLVDIGFDYNNYQQFAENWSGSWYGNVPTKYILALDGDISVVPKEMIIMQEYLKRYHPASRDGYNEVIVDQWNQLIGAKEAKDFIDSISENGEIKESLWNAKNTANEGFTDGLEDFGEGLEKIFYTEGIITENMYKKMYILEALKDTRLLDDIYNVSNSIGNMAIPMLVSITLSYVIGPSPALAILKYIPQLASSVLIGGSSAGNTYNQAMVDGYDRGAAAIYGFVTGLSETTLTMLFSKIPGFKPLFNMGIIGEGFEEFIQTFVDAGFKHIILGAEIDLEGLTDEAMTSFLYGCLTAMVLTGGETAVKLPIKIQNAGIKSYTDLVNYFNCKKLCHSKTVDGKKIIMMPEGTDAKTYNMFNALESKSIVVPSDLSLVNDPATLKFLVQNGIITQSQLEISLSSALGSDIKGLKNSDSPYTQYIALLDACIKEGITVTEAKYNDKINAEIFSNTETNIPPTPVLNDAVSNTDSGEVGSVVPEVNIDSVKDVPVSESFPESNNNSINLDNITDSTEVETLINDGTITKGDVKTYLTNLLGVKLAGWNLTDENGYSLYMRLLNTCNNVGINISDVQSLGGLLDSMIEVSKAFSKADSADLTFTKIVEEKNGNEKRTIKIGTRDSVLIEKIEALLNEVNKTYHLKLTVDTFYNTLGSLNPSAIESDTLANRQHLMTELENLIFNFTTVNMVALDGSENISNVATKLGYNLSEISFINIDGTINMDKVKVLENQLDNFKTRVIYKYNELLITQNVYKMLREGKSLFDVTTYASTARNSVRVVSQLVMSDYIDPQLKQGTNGWNSNYKTSFLKSLFDISEPVRSKFVEYMSKMGINSEDGSYQGLIVLLAKNMLSDTVFVQKVEAFYDYLIASDGTSTDTSIASDSDVINAWFKVLEGSVSANPSVDSMLGLSQFQNEYVYATSKLLLLGCDQTTIDNVIELSRSINANINGDIPVRIYEFMRSTGYSVGSTQVQQYASLYASSTDIGSILLNLDDAVIISGVNDGLITKNQVKNMMTDLIGNKLGKWELSDDSAYNLYLNLRDNCVSNGIKVADLDVIIGDDFKNINDDTSFNFVCKNILGYDVSTIDNFYDIINSNAKWDANKIFGDNKNSPDYKKIATLILDEKIQFSDIGSSLDLDYFKSLSENEQIKIVSSLDQNKVKDEIIASDLLVKRKAAVQTLLQLKVNVFSGEVYESGYTADQILSLIVDARNGKYSVKAKTILINGIDYTTYFPKCDEFISIDHLANYTMELLNLSDADLENFASSINLTYKGNEFAILGEYLKENYGNLHVNGLIFQNAKPGDANFVRFSGNIGNTSQVYRYTTDGTNYITGELTPVYEYYDSAGNVTTDMSKAVTSSLNPVCYLKWNSSIKNYDIVNVTRIENVYNTSGGAYMLLKSPQELANTYPNLCTYDSGSQIFTITNMKLFGEKVLGGVPLDNVNGTYMITCQIPFNSDNLSMPSINNGSMYPAYGVPGGYLLDGEQEVVISATVGGQEIIDSVTTNGTGKIDFEGKSITIDVKK